MLEQTSKITKSNFILNIPCLLKHNKVPHPLYFWNTSRVVIQPLPWEASSSA